MRVAALRERCDVGAVAVPVAELGQDVAFDFIRTAKMDISGGGRVCKPSSWVYRMAETLLPYSVPSKRPAAKTKTELAREEKNRKREEEQAKGQGKGDKDKDGDKDEEKDKDGAGGGGGAGNGPGYAPEETPLPGRGRLLELWSQPGQKRRGWTMVECVASAD